MADDGESPLTPSDVMETVDAFLHGQTHLLCALADLLENSGGPTKRDMVAALRAKIAWLERANVDITVATPLLLAVEWLTEPPPDPRDPYRERHRGLRVVRDD